MNNSSSYIEVLKHPIIARLTLIQLISYFGTWFSQVAIASSDMVFMIYRRREKTPLLPLN